MQNLKIIITGKFHNTGFLFYTKQFAVLNKINGIVQYIDNNSIIIEAEGEEANLGRFIEYCRIGPLGANIETIKISQNTVQHYNSFEINDQDINLESIL